MDLSIIIVNWNTKQLLHNCLASIYRETQNISFEIFVVDNASSDGSAEMVKEKYPNIKLTQNQKNIGFSAANNQAVRQTQGRYVLVLNSDTIILHNALDKAIRIMDARPEIGILAPKTYSSDYSVQKTIRSDPALLSQIFLLTKAKYLLPAYKLPGSNVIEAYYRTDLDYNQESFIGQAQGSFLLIKRELIDKIGLFDEKFFIWFEEVDFCLRARKAGYRILYSPRIEIIHYGGESFSQITTIKKQQMFNKALFYYFWKNKPRWQYFALRLFEIPSLILAGMAGVIKRIK